MSAHCGGQGQHLSPAKTFEWVARYCGSSESIPPQAIGYRHRLSTDDEQDSSRITIGPSGKLILSSSIVLVLLFDALTNVAAAFAGAGPLLVLAAPAFIGYVCCVRVAFARL